MRVLKSQNHLVDGKMMVKFMAVAVICLARKPSKSVAGEKVAHIMMNKIMKLTLFMAKVRVVKSTTDQKCNLMSATNMQNSAKKRIHRCQ